MCMCGPWLGIGPKSLDLSPFLTGGKGDDRHLQMGEREELFSGDASNVPLFNFYEQAGSRNKLLLGPRIKDNLGDGNMQRKNPKLNGEIS